MNSHEIERVTSAIHRLRPDWPIKQLDTLIRDKLADRPRRDVAVALTWIACDAATSTPYRVLESGPWWIAVGVDGQTTGRRVEFDPAVCCVECSQPEARCQAHAKPDHAFLSVADHARRTDLGRPKETTDAI